MDYAQFMNELFYFCVFILKWGSLKLGMTYEELNIWVFVVIHPLITLGFAAAWWRARRAHNLHIQQSCYLERPANTHF